MSDHDEVSSGGNSGSTSDSDEGYGSYEGYASSIDYCYSEEETYYVPENDDTGDENRSKSLAEYVDKADHLNEGISTNFSERRVPDSKIDRKPLTYVDFYAKEVDGFKLSKPPSKRNWMRTWPTTSKQAVVSVYCFFNQFEGFGGYAVIVRNMSLTPVAASVKFTRYALTYLHEVLMGLEAGLDLALKHGCSSPSVLCNSRLVVRLLSKVAEGCHCKSTTVSTICQICTMKIVPHMDPLYFTRLVPLIETLQGKRGSSTFEWDSGKNEAAHCLAKLIKLNALYGHVPFYEEDMENPEDFPDGVVNVLYRDAFPIRYYTGFNWNYFKGCIGQPPFKGSKGWKFKRKWK
ncbi:hypothetical protein MKX03_019068 [Papaver bracteatum]|nr:hypothetical protein MKX03_019068 [Papaver bracteatum]